MKLEACCKPTKLFLLLPTHTSIDIVVLWQLTQMCKIRACIIHIAVPSGMATTNPLITILASPVALSRKGSNTSNGPVTPAANAIKELRDIELFSLHI